MATAGGDLIVPHVGLTAGGSIGAMHALSLEDAVTATQAMIQAAREVNPRVIALAHGGPIVGPEDLAYILAHTEAKGLSAPPAWNDFQLRRP